jgi:hypothetical protein
MLQEAFAGTEFAVFAETGLLLFLAAFIAIAVRVLSRPAQRYDAMARAPLQDDHVSDDASARSRPGATS